MGTELHACVHGSLPLDSVGTVLHACVHGSCAIIGLWVQYYMPVYMVHVLSLDSVGTALHACVHGSLSLDCGYSTTCLCTWFMCYLWTV